MQRMAMAEDYSGLIDRLSERSTRKHFDAYRDVPWDDPEYAIDPDDSRWELPEWDELGATTWYRSRPPGVRSRIGLHVIAMRMKIGWQFENVLQRGLLILVESLPNRSPEFRYAHHEIIEESQHSLMFQEFVDRTGIDVPALPLWMRIGNRPVVGSASWFPEMFFLHVLSGEEPIDYVQRRMLSEQPNLHPLVRRISQIHVTEEARHVCFARHYLRHHVPRLGPVRKAILRLSAPLVFMGTATLMLRPLPSLVSAHDIPRKVVRDAYNDSPRHAQLIADSLAKVRELCEELELLTPRTLPLWQRLGAA
jgi:hypothetical protein